MIVLFIIVFSIIMILIGVLLFGSIILDTDWQTKFVIIFFACMFILLFFLGFNDIIKEKPQKASAVSIGCAQER